MTTTRLPPPVWMVTGLALQRLVTGRGAGSATGRVPKVVAGATAAVSLSLAAAAAARFRSAHTTVHPLHPEHATSLVTSGPNSLSRNPMYVAMAGVLVANAVRLGSPLALLPVAGFVALIDRTQVAAEERALRELFGADYEAYTRRVPRWLGPLG